MGASEVTRITTFVLYPIGGGALQVVREGVEEVGIESGTRGATAKTCHGCLGATGSQTVDRSNAYPNLNCTGRPCHGRLKLGAAAVVRPGFYSRAGNSRWAPRATPVSPRGGAALPNPIARRSPCGTRAGIYLPWPAGLAIPDGKSTGSSRLLFHSYCLSSVPPPFLRPQTVLACPGSACRVLGTELTPSNSSSATTTSTHSPRPAPHAAAKHHGAS